MRIFPSAYLSSQDLEVAERVPPRGFEAKATRPTAAVVAVIGGG
jgi:hypothetical protein